MKSLIFIIVGLCSSLYFTDISSSNVLFNVLAPLGIFIFFCLLCFWLILSANPHKKSSSDIGSVPVESSHYGGGDSGGGDGGC